MNLSLSISQLRYIVAVADAGAFGKAARICRVTQPTLSMQIQKAEELLDITLFDRRTQPVTPSPIGSRVVQQARVVVHEMEKIQRMILAELEEVSGLVRVAAIPTVAPYLLPLILPTLHERHPEVRLQVRELTTAEIIEALDRNELEVGILATPIPDESLLTVPLYNEPFWVYLSPQHVLSRHKQISSDQLSRDDLWLLSEGHCLRDQALSLCSGTDITGEQSVQFESGSIETLMNLLDRLPGYTLIPDLVRANLSSKRARQIRPFEGRSPAREISLVAHPSFHRGAVLNALYEAVLASVPATLIADQDHTVIPVHTY